MQKRNNALELYRFAASVLILFYHCYFFCFREEGGELFAGFYLFVEMFFILAGFMMLRHIRLHVTPEERADPVRATGTYMKRRLRQLYPHHLLSWLMTAALVLFVTREMSLREVVQAGWTELALVNVFGFVRGQYVNIVCWYLSALLFISPVIYYLLLKNERAFLFIAAPLLLVLCYGTLWDGKGSLAATIIFVQYAKRYGFLRSFADMIVGCLAWRACELLEQRGVDYEPVWATLLEAAAAVVGWGWMVRYSGYADFAFVPLFFCVIISIYRGKSLWSRLFSGKFCARLGYISYGYFLNNTFVIYLYRWLWPEETSIVRMSVLCALGCTILSAGTVWLVRRLTPPEGTLSRALHRPRCG